MSSESFKENITLNSYFQIANSYICIYKYVYIKGIIQSRKYGIGNNSDQGK